jgi:DNA-binding PadR family transcriptional regulator
VAKRRKVNSLLALPVLSALAERPMYPYQVAAMLKGRGKDQSVKVNWGSLYTVVQNLEKNGFIEEVETIRDGKQPERTVYQITDAGRAELLDWLSELIGVPEREYTRLAAGLSDAGHLHPDLVIELLHKRLATLEQQITAHEEMLAAARQQVFRLFLIESEYQIAMLRAEADWIRGLVTELENGTIDGVDAWRQLHDTGTLTPEFQEIFDQEARKYE